jgi:DNA repair protein RecN (Recombination protein N)
LLRREISQAGKSRAFINDTPVNLNVLKDLGSFLVDIHSQHDSLLLSNPAFQLGLVDELANHEQLLLEYRNAYRDFRKLQKDMADMQKYTTEKAADLDYLKFQYDELQKAKLVEGEWEELRSRLEILTHAVELHSAISVSLEFLSNNESSTIGQVRDAVHQLSKITKYLPELQLITDRLGSCLIELKDISAELSSIEDRVYFDENELNTVQNRLDIISQLMHKHRVQSEPELIQLRDELSDKIQLIDHSDLELEKLARQVKESQAVVTELSKAIHFGRSQAAPRFELEVAEMLSSLGMPNARFHVQIDPLAEPESNGSDKIRFLFTANKGGHPEEIGRVASGGELSRLMLSIKSLLSGRKYTPTLIFDEIDTGVSGEIAAKVGIIMASMAERVQVISISHLPQIAGKAKHHLLVYKKEQTDRTTTSLMLLDEQQRIDEIAKMLSDGTITSASRNAAKELIKVE